MSKIPNPRAFPSNAIAESSGGMTLRDWFAGQAVNGMMSAEGEDVIYALPQVAARAYALADAMLAERAK